MAMTGWVKIHRSILNWEWYSDINTRLLFFHLLVTVNYTDGKWQGKEIKRGSRVTSLGKLSDEVGLSLRQVRTSLSKLVLTGEVTDRNFNRGRVITVVNYDSYQSIDNQNDNQVTGKRQSDDNQMTIKRQSNDNNIRKKERKKERKQEGKNIYSEQVAEVFDYWIDVFGKSKATKLSAKRKKKITDRLKDGYTVEQLQCAILGCSNSDYHTEGGYTDIELICREPEKTDRFIELNRPKVANKIDDADWYQDWLDEKTPKNKNHLRIIGD